MPSRKPKKGAIARFLEQSRLVIGIIRVSFPSEPQTNETDDARRRLLGWHFTPQSRSHVGVGAHFFNQQTSAAGVGGESGIHGRARGRGGGKSLPTRAGVAPRVGGGGGPLRG